MLRNTNAALDVRTGRSGSDSWPGRARHTVIQGDLTIIGDLLTDGHIEVDGRVIGNVNGRTVTVGENGQVEGSILAESITIHGTVAGPVQANQVRLGKSARVNGNIFHNELTIEPGAHHEGRRPWRPQIERKPIFGK
ncbi:MAG: polymer-forming cytoskeletal protein [Proteobacteria bacterium]|nr:polymer-forming cytoskeletal protein [Pseudomonadota bacterium]MCH8998659.1 polymer-forming cytoskeletal protein [Pseudomonadota bacterium]